MVLSNKLKPEHNFHISVITLIITKVREHDLDIPRPIALLIDVSTIKLVKSFLKHCHPYPVILGL